MEMQEAGALCTHRSCTVYLHTKMQKIVKNLTIFLGYNKNILSISKNIVKIFSIGIQFDNFLGYKTITKNRESLFTSFIGIQFDDIFDKKLEILTCATEAFPAHASKNVKAKVAIGRFVKVF